MAHNYTEELKQQVCDEIQKGVSIKEIAKKYHISEYYAKIWTGEIYKKMDLDTYVRRRYRWLCMQIRDDLENSIGSAMTEREHLAISDETWEKWDEEIKIYLYEFAKLIVKAN